MRNKSISKQSGGHKQSGGGGAFSSMFSSSPPPPEPIDILLITTHGHFLDEELTVFKSPIENIRKINATPIGCGINLNDSVADLIKNGISQINKIDIDAVSNKIKELLQTIHHTLNVNKKHIKITEINKGDDVINKEYIVVANERVKTPSPYFDSVTLLSRLPYVDLFQEIGGRSYHKEDIFVSLYEILEYIKKNFPDINNLIVVDLSCARFKSTRHNIQIKRGVPRYGGYYKKIHKKFKKTNNKKLARKALVKKNKTRKIKRP